LLSTEEEDGPAIAQRTFARAPQWCLDSSHKLASAVSSHRCLVRCRTTLVSAARPTPQELLGEACLGMGREAACGMLSCLPKKHEAWGW
jgi:hypothetical protein